MWKLAREPRSGCGTRPRHTARHNPDRPRPKSLRILSLVRELNREQIAAELREVVGRIESGLRNKLEEFKLGGQSRILESACGEREPDFPRTDRTLQGVKPYFVLRFLTAFFFVVLFMSAIVEQILPKLQQENESYATK
jgi:hypothetical protein